MCWRVRSLGVLLIVLPCLHLLGGSKPCHSGSPAGHLLWAWPEESTACHHQLHLSWNQNVVAGSCSWDSPLLADLSEEGAAGRTQAGAPHSRVAHHLLAHMYPLL